jgi:hypothetical protein
MHFNALDIVLLSIYGVLFIMSFIIDNTRVFRELYTTVHENPVNSVYHESTVVLGIALEDGSSICYPIEDIVIPRHLINDTFNGKPLFVSFCAACRSAIVYDPVLVSGERLNFQVIAVWRRNMIIRDKETGTLWQQGTGQGLYGKYKDLHLKMLMSQQMTLKDWLEKHPKSKIGVEPKNHPEGLFSKKKLLKMLKITERKIMPGQTLLGDELPPREKIFGLELQGVSRAYPISELKKKPNFTDLLAGSVIEINYNSKTNHIQGKNTTTGEDLLFQSHWWFGWKEFHPFTEIYKYKE